MAEKYLVVRFNKIKIKIEIKTNPYNNSFFADLTRNERRNFLTIKTVG